MKWEYIGTGLAVLAIGITIVLAVPPPWWPKMPPPLVQIAIVFGLALVAIGLGITGIGTWPGLPDPKGPIALTMGGAIALVTGLSWLLFAPSFGARTLAAPALADASKSLDFTIALVCELSQKTGIEPNDKKLNLLYISAPNGAPSGSDLLNWLSNQYTPPSKEIIDWSQFIKGQLYRCSFYNQSVSNISRISVDLQFQLKRAVTEGSTNTAAELITEGTFPVEYIDVPANSRNNHFYITNAGETWLTVIKPSVAKIMKPGSNVWKEVKLMDLGGRPDHRFSLVPANLINPPAAPLPSPAPPAQPTGTSPQTSP